MKPAIALIVVLMSACAGSAADPGAVPTGASPVADSCAVARPDFGTAFDRLDWLHTQIGLDARK